jgi:hypothetical protein
MADSEEEDSSNVAPQDATAQNPSCGMPSGSALACVRGSMTNRELEVWTWRIGKVLDSVQSTTFADVASDFSWRLQLSMVASPQDTEIVTAYIGGAGLERSFSSSSGSSTRRKLSKLLEMEKGMPCASCVDIIAI